MYTGILLVNLFLNSLIINGQEACVISSVQMDAQHKVLDSFTNQPVLGSCKEFASVVLETAQRDFPGAAIALTLNGDTLNAI